MFDGHVILLGPPGSGKGTQANLLKSLGYQHISTGDLLRDEIKRQTEIGYKIKGIINAGHFVDDATAFRLISENVDLDSGKFVFDGYPRNIQQAHDMVKWLGQKQYKVFLLDIDLEPLVDRLLARRVCRKCNAVYNLMSLPPKNAGFCDQVECDADLIQRADDERPIISERFEVFKDTFKPLVDFFRSRGKLSVIDADRDIKTVLKKIKAQLD